MKEKTVYYFSENIPFISHESFLLLIEFSDDNVSLSRPKFIKILPL